MSHCSQTFPGIFIEKTRFEEFEEIWEQINGGNKKFNIMIKKK